MEPKSPEPRVNFPSDLPLSNSPKTPSKSPGTRSKSPTTPSTPATPSIVRRRSTLLQPVTNPFENPAPWTPYEKFKCGLLCWSLLPVRVILLIPAGLLHIGFCSLATLGAKMENDRGTIYTPEPFPWWREMLLWPAACTNRFILCCFGFWRIRLVDRRKNKSLKPKVIVVAPHQQFIDPFILATIFPPLPAGVGKKELLSMPLFGKLGHATQGIYVDRKNPDSRHSCKEIIAAHSSQSWKGPPMVIFPEGTTTNGQALIQFKAGAFAPGEPVQPVLLRYPHRFYDSTWCGKNSNLGVAILRTMLQFVNFCEVTLLEPHAPSDAEKKDPILFANSVRSTMATELGVGTTEHSYDDLFFAAAAEKANISQDFEMSAVRSKYDLNMDQLKDLLKQFHAFDTDHSGNLTYEEFAKALRGADGQAFSEEASIDRLFSFFDTDGSGQISYREFVQGAAVFSAKCSNATRAKLAFLIFDIEGTRRVSTAKLQNALESPLNARVAELAGGRAELDFASFCDLVEQEPEVVQAAMDIARKRFSFEGSSNKEADEE